MVAFDLKDENFRCGFILESWFLKSYHNHVWVKENFFQEKKDEKNKKETVFMLPRKKIEEELRIFNTVCSVKY